MKKETVDPDFSQTENLVREKGKKSNHKPDPINPELLSRLRAGEHDAFQCVYLQSVDSIRNFLTLLLHSRDQAEELAQDIFVRLWERHEEIDPTANFRSYLFRLTKWAAFNFLDHKKVEKKYQDFVTYLSPDFSASPDDLISTEELALVIRLHVERMPEKQRKVFEMSRFEGKSNAEIAQILKITDATVRVHLHMATVTLKRLLTLLFLFSMPS